MREITVKLFSFEELNEEAKAKAIGDWRCGVHEYDWIDEIQDSADAIAKAMSIKISFDGNCYQTSCSWETNGFFSDEEWDMTGARLIAWIEKRIPLKVFSYDIRQKFKVLSQKGYTKHSKWALAKTRYEDNLLTGYCDDYCYQESLFELVDEMKRGNKVNLETFFDKLCEHFAKAVDIEIENQNSDEYISEHLIINEYEFYEDGSVYGW